MAKDTEIRIKGEAAEAAPAHRRYAIIVSVLTCFVMPFMGNAMNLSVPQIGDEFGASASLVGWMITSYMLTVAALGVPMGKLADMTSRRNILIAGAIVMTAGCVAAAFAVSMEMLIAMRCVQGAGAAMLTSTNLPLLISTYPPAMRGKALGIGLTAVYTGGALGPVLGGILNHNTGWRSIFIFVCIILAVAVVIAAVKLPAYRAEASNERFDCKGSIMFVVFITALVYGLSECGSGLVPAAIGLLGIAAGVVFVWYELRTEDPVIDVRLFRSNIGYAMSNVSALMNYAATAGITYLISIYLQVVQGYSSQTAGIIMLAQPIIMATLTAKFGKLSDTHSPFKLSSLGMAVCAVGTSMFIFIGRDTGMLQVVAALVITGLGFAMFSSPNTNAILSCVDRKDYSAANAIVGTMRTVGQTSSMVLITIVVSCLLPGLQLSEADPDQLIRVIKISFIIFTCICLTGIVFSLMRKKK